MLRNTFRFPVCHKEGAIRLILMALTSLTAFAADPGLSKFAAEFGKRWAVTRKLAIGVAEAMPATDYGFRPNPAIMSFSEQMSHIALINYAFCAGLKDKDAPEIGTPTDKDGIVQLMENSFDYCSDVIAAITDQQLDSVHQSPDGRLNGREVLLALYVHMAHHRGQAEIYLRTKGIKPPPYVF